MPTIKFKPNLLEIFSVIGAQIKPLPWVAIKLTISGVTNSAAARKSPSFSLFLSSTTITILPSLMSFIADSIVFSLNLSSDIFFYFFVKS